MRGLRKTDIPVSVGGVIGDGIFTLISCSLACFCYICTKRKGAFACCGESRVRVRHTPDIRCGIRGRRPAGFRPGRERSRSRITRQMKTILSLVALLAATAGLRGQGGASADDSGPAPDALREWSVEETDALLSGLLAAYDDSWEALSVSVFLSYAMHRAVTTVAAVAFCLPGSIWPILRRGRCVGAR